MTNISCFYNQPTCTNKITREHVISGAVLRAVFGNPIRNAVSGEFLGGKVLIDHEAMIKDVCDWCNNAKLSPYDLAGVALVQQLLPIHDPTNLRLAFSRETMCWFIKTHLNHFRVIKDRETGEVYPVDNSIKAALIEHSDLPYGCFKFLIEGWTGEAYFWDAEDERHIQWTSYRSVRFRNQRIILSELRLKTLITWLILPSDGNYDDFEYRASSALLETLIEFCFVLQTVDVQQAITDGYIDLERVLPLKEVRKFIYKKK